MQGYVRSGLGTESGHPLRSSFAHYEEMRFLDDTVKTTPTVSSVQHLLEANSSHVDLQVMSTCISYASGHDLLKILQILMIPYRVFHIHRQIHHDLHHQERKGKMRKGKLKLRINFLVSLMKYRAKNVM